MPHVVDDADDAEPDVGVEAHRPLDAMIDRVRAREVPLRHGPVDDNHALRAAVVGGGQRAAAHQRNLHRLKIAGRDVALIDDRRRLAGGRRPSLDLHGVGVAQAAERHDRNDAGRQHAAHRAEPRDEIADQLRARRRRRVTRASQRDAKRQDVLRVEARLHAREPHDAVQHEARSRQENHRKRDLRGDQRVAAATGRRRRGRSRGAAERRAKPLAWPVRGERAKHDADNARQRCRERGRSRGEINRQHFRQRGGE